MSLPAALSEHLQGGTTTVCRCWSLTRKDGTFFGFTDHDRDLSFDGKVFRADSGLTSFALQQSTGLSVDNTEALGVLSSLSVTESDIDAGRFDDAEVIAYLVNWKDVAQRAIQFRGAIGEIERVGGAFKAELRGLSDRLNQRRARLYQPTCGAALGDQRCQVDLSAPGYSTETTVISVTDAVQFDLPLLDAFEAGWFELGLFEVTSGAAAGLSGTIKRDAASNGGRLVELWDSICAPVAEGDQVRLTAGCDKRPETCRLKFQNFANFRGFPHIPGEDWLISYPVSGVNTSDDGQA